MHSIVRKRTKVKQTHIWVAGAESSKPRFFPLRQGFEDSALATHRQIQPGALGYSAFFDCNEGNWPVTSFACFLPGYISCYLIASHRVLEEGGTCQGLSSQCKTRRIE